MDRIRWGGRSDGVLVAFASRNVFAACLQIEQALMRVSLILSCCWTMLMQWSMRFASPEVPRKTDELSRSEVPDRCFVKVYEPRGVQGVLPSFF